MIFILEYKISRVKFKASPAQIIVCGFAIIILIGALLLNTSMATRSGEQIGFLNALFTATSSVCVTGLVVVDTGTYWNTFGQTIIMILIQIGGLGFMTIAILFGLLIGKRITLKERLIVQEALNQFSLEGMVRLIRNIIGITFSFEILGAVCYAFQFIPQFGVKKGIFYSIFHSVAAFCNAGFDLMGDFSSFTSYANNPLINITTMALIIMGGLGFTVWIDLLKNKLNFKRYGLQTKVVLVMTPALILVGAFLIYVFEYNNAATLGSLTPMGKVWASFFHSVTTRTAGFNTIDLNALSISAQFITVIFMFIGGSPASTAGGVKTTTLAIILFTMFAAINGREDAEIFKKRIPKMIVYRALTITLLSFTLICCVTLLLTITEHIDFMHALFETVSAFGTVGLSMNVTTSLSKIGRVIIMLTMFAGRVGPVTFVVALAKKAYENKNNYKLPVDKLMVG